jgi:phage tail-like protein
VAETGARTDPALSFRFEVRLIGLPPGGFAECSGLGLETEVAEYAEGGLNDRMHKFATRTKQSPLVLRKGIVDRALWDWFFDFSLGRAQFRDGTVIIRDEAGRGTAAEWRLSQAFPSKWTGPDLNATQSAVAVETLELTHSGLERRR